MLCNCAHQTHRQPSRGLSFGYQMWLLVVLNRQEVELVKVSEVPKFGTAFSRRTEKSTGAASCNNTATSQKFLTTSFAVDERVRCDGHVRVRRHAHA